MRKRLGLRCLGDALSTWLPVLMAKRLMLWILAAVAARARAASCSGEWIDIDSPDSACNDVSQRSGTPLTLVFSDEFEVDDRTFHDGDDSRFTGLNLAPNTNEQVNYYNSSLAFTSGGVLMLRTTSEDVTLPTSDGAVPEVRHLQTAMLQTWNKFCFSEGATEIRARLPGRSSQEGLWPAFWMMGNLGRATFDRSTDGIWPWIFDECVEPDDPDCAANQCNSQRISACNGSPGHGLLPYQGRGSPEIDVIEVQPGKYVNDYGSMDYFATLGCSTPSEQTKSAVRMRQPFVSTSLQAAPGMPRDALERPKTGCVPQTFVNQSGGLLTQWYQPDLNIFDPGSASSSYQVGVNYEFYGDFFEQYANGSGLQTDAYSVNTQLAQGHWDSFHTYRVEWRSGVGGYMRWSLDGAVQFQIDESLVRTQRRVSNVDGTHTGTMRSRIMPTEPMCVLASTRKHDLYPVPCADQHSCAMPAG